MIHLLIMDVGKDRINRENGKHLQHVIYLELISMAIHLNNK